MKLPDLSDDQLEDLIRQLRRKSQHNMNRFKRWEAQQKLNLALAEKQKRRGANGLLRRFKRWFNP